MQGTVAEIKPYRPKKGAAVIDEDKVYEFELVTRYEASRPRDKKTDTPLGMGWPPLKSYPNHGTGYNAKTKNHENWRYIEGQSSIFISEQPELEEYEKRDIYELLGQDQNQLDFKDGKMMVRGDAAGQLRLQALFVQDYYVGNENKRIKTRPQMDLFMLKNPDEIVEKDNTIRDTAFKTMEQARNCTITEMLAVSFIMGINIDDISDAGLNKIKNSFLAKADYDPRNPKGLEFFMSVINNPTTKIKFIFSQGFQHGIISADQQKGKLTWAKPNTVIMDLPERATPTDELTRLVMERKKLAIEVMEEIEKQLNA